METYLVQICNQFLHGINIQNIIPYGSGHINDTYKVETDEKNYLLQRINHEIFKNIEGLTDNIVKITTYLNQKIEKDNLLMQSLKINKTADGKYIFRDDSGNYWRLFDFVENSISYDLVKNREIACEGGRAYGWFVNILNDFPVNELVETIPDFHNAKFRIGNFRKAVRNDIVNRSRGVKYEIEALEERTGEMMHLYSLAQDGKIPMRVTHNDTKFNNVLFNKKGKGICVIDLDTVMPGFVFYDFGDAIRTFTNTANEDEQDLEKVSVNMDLFEGFAKGFLSQAKAILTPLEIDNLAFSTRYIAYEQSIRFLTDYLEGDIYYKTKYPEHNLHRAKTQLKLLESLEGNFEKMKGIVLRSYL